MKRLAVTAIAAAMTVAACSGGDAALDSDDTTSDADTAASADGDTTAAPGSPATTAEIGVAVGEARSFGPAPATPDGPLDVATVDALDRLFESFSGQVDVSAFAEIRDTADPRLAWLMTDVMRFVGPGGLQNELVTTFEALTGDVLDVERSTWGSATDRLIAWDTSAPPDYARWKGQVFGLIEPGWASFFDDADATIDWRWVSWGGVLIDDRPLDETDTPCPGGCIPALNDPALTDASGGDWFDDDSLVFGVVVGDEAVAFPKNIMEVHEMVNITIGERRVAIPYCTLCGSAQAYLTDDVIDDPIVGETYEIRTSGLLSRSNKVMYEFHTRSVFDTFTGEAVAGPLREAGVVLEQISVRTSTWGDWKAAHPDTSIVAEDGGIGRRYADDPLRGRDDDGPIFPIGDVDPRLEVHERVLGIVLDDGTTIAFPVDAAQATLERAGSVELGGVELRLDRAGVIALDADGDVLASHEAFWFAWSQFHPDTLLWLP